MVSRWGNEFHKSSVPGPQYQFSLVGRVSYRPKANSQYVAHLIFRMTAWSGGLAARFNVEKNSYRVLTGDAVDAFLESDGELPLKSARAQSWWPLTNLEWKATEPESFWPPDDISRDFAMIYVLPRIPHDQLRPGNYKFERAPALMAYRTAFENAAH